MKDLESIGFKVNIYDPYVDNMVIYDKQIKITWHVNDLKVSHDYKDIEKSFIKCTKDTYEDNPFLSGHGSGLHKIRRSGIFHERIY